MGIFTSKTKKEETKALAKDMRMVVEDPKEGLENTIYKLLTDQPFYAELIMKCKISMGADIPTAGVRILPSGSLEMYLNPEFFLALNNEERCGLVMHEMLHLMQDHISRGAGLDPKRANIAMDNAINQFIPKKFLPTMGITPEGLAKDLKVDVPHKKDFEEYYLLLKNHQKNLDQYNNCPVHGNGKGQPQQGQGQSPGQGQGQGQQGQGQGQQGQGSGSGQGHECQDGQGNGNGQGQGGNQQSPQGQGSGSGQGQEQQGQNGQEGQGQGSGGQENRGEYKHSHSTKGKTCNCPHDHGQGEGQGQGQGQQGQGSGQKVLDNHDYWETGVQDEEMIKRAVRAWVDSAKEETIRRHGEGSIPRELIDKLEDILKEKVVDWRKVVKNFVGRKLTFESTSTRKRPNRRLGLKSTGKKNKLGPGILFATDCSGSVGDHEYLTFLSEAVNATKLFREKAKMLFFDWDILRNSKGDAQIVLLGDQKKLPRRPMQGGTNFQPVIDYANKTKPDLLVIFTDGEAPAPTRCTGCPVLWVIMGGHDNPSLIGKRLMLPKDWDKKKVSKMEGKG